MLFTTNRIMEKKLFISTLSILISLSAQAVANSRVITSDSTSKKLSHYNYIHDFYNNHSVVFKNIVKDGGNVEAYGLINTDGKEIIPPTTYVGLESPNKKGYVRAFTLNKNKRYNCGVIDMNNNIIIPFKYRDLNIWKDYDYIIYQEGMLIGEGVMNYKGQVLISHLNSYPRITIIGKNVFAVLKDPVYSQDRMTVNGKCVFIDEKQNVLKSFPNYSSIGSNIGEGLFMIKSKITDKFGAIDAKGNEIIKPIYDEIGDFSEGLSRVNIRKYINNDTYDNQYGFINKMGEVVVPLIYKGIGNKFHEGLVALIFTEKEHKWGYMDKNQKIVIPATFREVEGFSSGLAKVVTDDNKNCFIDKTGKIIHTFDEIRSFVNGLAVIKINGKYAIIDSKGNIILKEDNE